MKTRYKWIHFVKVPHKQSKRVIWKCFNNNNADIPIGTVEYNFRWQKWEYLPAYHTAYTADCIRHIAEFIEQLKGETGIPRAEAKQQMAIFGGK